MSFAPSFSALQQLGTPSVITFIDTSAGSDVLIVSRRITLLKADGTNLYQASNWLIADISKSVDVLTKDYGLYVTVDWLSSSGSVLYSKYYAMTFVAYSSIFLSRLTQQEMALPNVTGGANYWENKAKLILLVDNAQKATSKGNDYKKAQVFLNKAFQLMNNQNVNF